MMRTIAAMAMSAVLTAPGLAQPPGFRDAALSRPEGVVGVGLTIPFGGVRQKEAPRVELRVARDVVNFDGSRQSSVGFRPIETRIGFSLEPDRKLLLNGRPLDTKRRNNVSTAGWIAIGVGVLLIGGAVLVADAASDASE